jgi:DNA-binding NarL/FixJ family response regulator
MIQSSRTSESAKPHELSDAIISVFIVQNVDRPITRAGLCHLLNSHPRFSVVGDSACRETVLKSIEEAKPDIVLFDTLECNGEALAFIGALTRSRNTPRVAALMTRAALSAQRHAVSSGVLGIVWQEQEPEVLFKALEHVHRGEVWLERSLVATVLQEKIESIAPLPSTVQIKIDTLTEREHAVITLVCQGMKNHVISKKLFVSEATVRHRLTSIFEKLQVSDRLELVIFAFQHGLAELPH